MLQLIQNEAIDDMHNEGELIPKSEVFDETCLFGYIPLSKVMEHVRNLKFEIQGESLHLILLELGISHLLSYHGIYFSHPMNGFSRFI